jgi:hypothetical protein
MGQYLYARDLRGETSTHVLLVLALVAVFVKNPVCAEGIPSVLNWELRIYYRVDIHCRPIIVSFEWTNSNSVSLAVRGLNQQYRVLAPVLGLIRQ